MTESAPNDSINVVLSLDDNQAASVDVQTNPSGDEGYPSRVDVDSDLPTYEYEGPGGDAVARKRVRFEE